MTNRVLGLAAGLLLLGSLVGVVGVLGRVAGRTAQTANPTQRHSPVAMSRASAGDNSPSVFITGKSPPLSGTKGSTDDAPWARLQALLGPCAPVGMGDAVCHEPLAAGVPLETWARDKSLVLANKGWENFQPEMWRAQFRELYRRPESATGAITDELAALTGDNIELVIGNFLDNRDNAGELKQSLTAVFDAPAMSEVVVYRIGDGQALAGVLLVGRQRGKNEVTCVYHLWD